MRFILGLLLLSTITASAGTVSRLYDFEPGTKAEADKVDAEFDNIISTLNGNINSANILDGGIATADLGSNSVTTAKINDAAVTTAKIGTGAVTNSNVGSAAIGIVNLAAANLVSASISDGFHVNSVSGSKKLLVSASITTGGNRPLAVRLMANAVTQSNILVTGSGTFTAVAYEWFLDGVSKGYLFRQVDNAGATPFTAYDPCDSVVNTIISPAAGSHTVTASATMLLTNAGITIFGCKLLLWEQ